MAFDLYFLYVIHFGNDHVQLNDTIGTDGIHIFIFCDLFRKEG